MTLPSMGAFLVHKLIVADERKNEAKKAKDYRQAYAVAKTVVHDPEEMERTKNVIQGLHKKRQQKMLKSSKEATKYVPEAHEAFHQVLEVFG
ncbi:MAG: GSU2403 family nucleotidyltransferase fold protein [Desulfovermiculus sp.]|nr:GSU2403 family nucleotidyltransferase fold protein [Desulfovermiculus sp.]